MAYIKKFEIQNFKGIENLTINIAERHKTPVVTLVGLNESGKTTILEALSHFITRVATISKEKDVGNSESLLKLVPIAKKANFTGKISISTVIKLEQGDMIPLYQKQLKFSLSGNEVCIQRA